MKITVLLLAGFCLLINRPTLAQYQNNAAFKSKLDALLEARFQPGEPGCMVLVASKGQLIYEKALGMASLELQLPLRPEMVFELGSITKQFTATAILQLVEQGKISLQDSLQKFIPDFPSKGFVITIENLLTHTSGIKDYMQIDYPEPYMERRDFKPKQLIDSFKNFALDFEPGTKFSYSNSGYFLLGYIIEKVSGKSYQAYIQQNLLRPTGMNHTWFDSANNIIPQHVNGYRKDGPVFKTADYWSMTIAYSAGGLISNAADLLKWHKALYSYTLLKKEALEKAFTPFRLKNGTLTDYGYGWFLKTRNGIHSIEHGGAISGFLANEIYFPAEDVFIVMLFNCDCAPKLELSVSIPGIVLGKPLQKETAISQSIMDGYIGTYAFAPDSTRKIIISKDKDSLVAKSDGNFYPLIFQSDTKFEFKNIPDAHCEFIKENNRVVKFIVVQNGVFEWKKIN